MGRVLLALVSALFLVMSVTAGTWTSNNFLYKPATGARGDEEKAKFDSGLNRVDSRLANEKWLNDPLYSGDLATAITTIGSAKAVLSIPAGNWPIAANLTVPATLTLKFVHGAVFTVATGKTLTINGPLDAGLYQIFSCTGTGKVVMKAEAVKVPEWWGATGDGATDDTAALQAWATCGGILNLPKKTYKITAGIIVPQYANIDGQGAINQAIDTVEGLIVKDDVVIKNISLTGSMVAYGPHYLHVGIICYSFRGGSGNDPAVCPISTYVGKRVVVENVKFTGWDICTMLAQDSIVRFCKATNNWREAFYFAYAGNQIVHNEIDGVDSWAIDFNGGNNLAAFNKIKNVGRTLVDGGGICFAGLTTEKPMTGLRAVGNNIEDCGVGYGIIACSQPTNGVLGDLVFADNTLNGKSTGVSRTAIMVYPGAGSTTMMTNINITGNLATKWDTFIQGYYLRGGAIANNVGKTFTPNINAAMPFGAIDSVVIANNVCKEVAGGANTVMKIEGSNNNNRIVDNIGSGANIGLYNADSAGTKNDISGN
ncbi:MAG: hypothetical protein Q8L00_11235, partial [Deltaproteobacteria bacterium]|nr:hypothetical protein [Deltaproteobacteria bacterium]